MEGSRVFLIRALLGFLMVHLVSCQNCELSWLSFDEMCFKHFYQPVNFSEAEEHCNDVGGRLLSNLTDNLTDYLNYWQNENSSFWCSTTVKDMLNSFDFPLPLHLQRRKRDASSAFSFWDEECYYIQNKSIIDDDCDELRGYICEKESTPELPPCPQSTNQSPDLFDWATARHSCECKGGSLYSYHDASEEKMVLENVKNKREMWIGLKREPYPNVFRWSDGSLLDYANWAPGQPEMKDNTRLCVAHSGQNLQWIVFDCSASLPFLCNVTSDVPIVSIENFLGTDRNPRWIEMDFSDPDMYSHATEEGSAEIDVYDVSTEEYSTDTTETISVMSDVSTEEYITETDTSDFAAWTEEDFTQTDVSDSTLWTEGEGNFTESEFRSMCSPIFDSCYVAGAVIGGTVLLISTAFIAVEVARWRTSKKKNKEVGGVQLMNIQSHKEDIPPKTEAGEVIEVVV